MKQIFLLMPIEEVSLIPVKSLINMIKEHYASSIEWCLWNNGYLNVNYSSDSTPVRFFVPLVESNNVKLKKYIWEEVDGKLIDKDQYIQDLCYSEWVVDLNKVEWLTKTSEYYGEVFVERIKDNWWNLNR